MTKEAKSLRDPTLRFTFLHQREPYLQIVNETAPSISFVQTTSQNKVTFLQSNAASLTFVSSPNPTSSSFQENQTTKKKRNNCSRKKRTSERQEVLISGDLHIEVDSSGNKIIKLMNFNTSTFNIV